MAGDPDKEEAITQPKKHKNVKRKHREEEPPKKEIVEKEPEPEKADHKKKHKKNETPLPIERKENGHKERSKPIIIIEKPDSTNDITTPVVEPFQKQINEKPVLKIFISNKHDNGGSSYYNKVAIVSAYSVKDAKDSLDKELAYLGCLTSAQKPYDFYEIPRDSGCFAVLVNIEEEITKISDEIVSKNYLETKQKLNGNINQVFCSEYHGGLNTPPMFKFAFVVAHNNDVAKILLDEKLKSEKLKTSNDFPYAVKSITWNETPQVFIMHKKALRK